MRERRCPWCGDTVMSTLTGDGNVRGLCGHVATVREWDVGRPDEVAVRGLVDEIESMLVSAPQDGPRRRPRREADVTTTPEPLPPCPFCGGVARLSWWRPEDHTIYSVGCTEPACETDPEVHGDTREAAKAAWRRIAGGDALDVARRARAQAFREAVGHPAAQGRRVRRSLLVDLAARPVETLADALGEAP
jgi:hypothetical protein